VIFPDKPASNGIFEMAGTKFEESLGESLENQ